MDYRENYENWLTWADAKTKKELLALKDEKEIEDRFYRDLEFGTAGLRGVMGAGSNRMNKYTVRRATKGFADYLKAHFAKEIDRGVVIAFDTRNHSKDFAREAAKVMTSAGIPVKLFRDAEPIPVLSFSVRHFRALGGIVITASHNPREYNGYKVYGPDGGQLVPRDANVLTAAVEAVTDMAHIDAEGNKDLLTMLGQDTVNLFISEIFKESTLKGKPYPIKIVYTPIHGSGAVPVKKILKRAGFVDVEIVAEQEKPDGNFPTVSSPNPENQDALEMGISLAKKTGADIVIGTDPDSDRIGAAVRAEKDFRLISGNQMGALLTDYLIRMHKHELTPASTMVTTIVTGSLGEDIARKHGVQVVETLTGFKYIGEKMTEWEKDPSHDFLFGYEESYGYLTGTHARDKDAVVTAMVICEMASYYKHQGKTLVDVLNDVYKEYSYRLDRMTSYTLKGKEGLARIAAIMEELRKSAAAFNPDIAETLDYQKGLQGLPKENVLKFMLTDGSWIAVRPSGTEPKIKIYVSLKGAGEKETLKQFEKYKTIWESALKL